MRWFYPLALLAMFTLNGLMQHQNDRLLRDVNNLVGALHRSSALQRELSEQMDRSSATLSKAEDTLRRCEGLLMATPPPAPTWKGTNGSR